MEISLDYLSNLSKYARLPNFIPRLMPIDQFKVSVIAPMFNEEMLIGTFIEKISTVMEQHFTQYELILIDDGSTDATEAMCLPYIKTNKSIRLISFSRNYGHEIASTAGFDSATGDYVILMDADLQHPPELIPALVEKALEGYDVVLAARRNRHHETWFRKTMARLFYKVAKKMTNFNISADTGNFRLLSKKVVKALRKMRENDRHLIMMFAYVGYKSATVPYDCLPRIAGQSKYGFLKRINLAVDSIVSFSSRPLRIMSCISLFISGLMMCYAGFILMEKLFSHQQLADGVASVIFLIAGLFSVLFLFLAIISEYISRILVESKNRPLYNVKEEITYESIHSAD